jgi:hypothetical protein
MTILLNNIYTAIELQLIDSEQAMYLIYTYSSIDYPISSKRLLELTKLKYIVSGRIGKALMIEENISLNVSGTIKPIYNTEVSKKIPTKILNLVGVKDPITNNLKFPSGEVTIQHTTDNFLKGEGLIAYHYLIFLFMFPIEGENNKRWEKHFNNSFAYKGVRLRLRSKGSATAFKRIVKKKDMGVFLYGTYLFIKSSIRENKAYVKSISNYMSEYEEWYIEAETKIAKAKDVESLFRVKIATEGRLNVAI